MQTHAHLTHVILVYYATNHFVGLFYEYCLFIRQLLEKINIHCELVMSQPHWFAGSQLDISKFSMVNNFLVYYLICMKFEPNSLVLEILSFWLWFYCFRSLSFNNHRSGADNPRGHNFDVNRNLLSLRSFASGLKKISLKSGFILFLWLHFFSWFYTCI